MKLDNERWKLRADIAARITPERIQDMASRLSPLKPIAGEFPAPPLVAASPSAPGISPPPVIAAVPPHTRPGGHR
jgi:hypothetical protein